MCNIDRTLLLIILGSWTVNALAQSPWQRTYGGYGSDSGYDIIQTSDSGFIIVGSTGSFNESPGSGYFFKISPDGEIEWSKYMSGDGVRTIRSIDRDQADGFVLAGS